MLVIRLFRTGKKHQPFFKIVVTDKKNPPKGGRFKEQLGFYNPLTKERSLKAERIKYWLSVGAKVSDTVHNLLVKEGIIKGEKIPVHKKPKKKSASAAAAGGKEEKKPAEKAEEKSEEMSKEMVKPEKTAEKAG